MSFVRQVNAHHSYQIGKDSIRNGSVRRVGVIPDIISKVGFPNPMLKEPPAPISNLDRKR